MKKCLLKHVIYMTKLFTLAFTLQCLSMSLLLAWNGNAQVKSIEEVNVNLSLNEVKVETAFKELENITDFNFVFAGREIQNSPLVTIESNGESLYDLLVSIATQTNLRFKQVNETIHVKKSDQESLVELVEYDDITISGKVTDENGEPLPGATISVLGTSIGTVSDIDGQYSITVPEGATVVYSYIGYESKSIEVGTQNLINVSLIEDQSSLEEVVVVGYGTVKKSDLTGSVASVSSEEIKDMALTSLEQGLQGRAAGVQVTQASGEPGGMSTIRIRGGNSLQGGNEPLYVIDGFPIYNGGGTNRPGTGANLNPLASINPSDIESMEILKDASATAIYGSRGANGVVLITTKGGQKGKDVISFESYYGIQEVRKKIDLMNANQLGELVNEAYVNDGLAPVFTDAEISSFGEGTDWQDEIFRQAPIQNHQLSFSGGDEKTTYSISGNYFDQKGIIINSDFTRYSGRVNVNRSVNQNLNIGTHLTVNRSVNNTIRSSTDGGGGTGVVLGALMMSPIQSVYQDEENSQYTLINDRGILVPNPVATAREIQNELITTRLLGDLYAEYQITDNLSAKVSFGADVINSKGNYYVPSYIVQGTGEGGIGNVNAMMSTTWLNENTLSYNKQLPNNNSINAIVGITFQGHRTEFIEASSQGFVSDELRAYSLQSGSVYNQPVTNAPEWGLVSYLGRLNYNLKEKYLFTFTGRIDGSSRFGEGNKYGYFPSGAFAWRLSDEGFIQNLGIFDDLKLRTSFGITGNQEIGQYNALATMVSDTYTFNENLVTGFRPNRVPNPMLQWEKTNQFDFGIDFGFFDNRLRLTTDYYHKITTDLLFSANIPWTSGFNSGLQNIGSVENRGLEISLGSDILTGEFVWTSNFNMAFNRNKILDLGEVNFFFAGGSSGHLKIENVSRVEVGRPVGTFYGYVFDGIFQNEEEVSNSAQPNAQPGDRRFRDLNDDGVITPEGDRTYLGNAQPKFFGGLTNNFNYKGFELNIFTQWSYGNDILNYNRFEMEAPTGDQNIASYMTERWTPSNPSTIYPRASRARTVFFSDRQLEDGSYLRIKTLTLAYTFPNLNSNRISGLRVYFTGQNFLTWTNYSGFDPEVSRYGATNLNLGEDYGVYPVSKSFILGCNFTLK